MGKGARVAFVVRCVNANGREKSRHAAGKENNML